MPTPSLFSEDLFAVTDREPPSVAGSETSIAAAKAIEPITGELRRAVYEFLKLRGRVGATDEELTDALGMNPSTLRPRRIELVESGWVRDSGEKRPTRSKRSAAVWIVSRTEES